MNQGKMAKPLMWLFFVLAIGSLIASGIYLEIMRSGTGNFWDIVRFLVYGLLGILWVYLFGQGMKQNA